METSNQSYAYQGRSVGHSTSQPARFNHQCLQCNRFITVIDALCDRIKNLESQVARAFADQTSAEKALLCILRLRERDDQVSLETSYKTAEGITKDAASLSQSFSSDDTLAEPVAEDRACSSAAIPCNDVPLIDLFESKINVRAQYAQRQSQAADVARNLTTHFLRIIWTSRDLAWERRQIS